MFVSGRDVEFVNQADVAVDDLSMMRHIDFRLDRDKKSVAADFLGVIRKSANYVPGYGCSMTFTGYPPKHLPGQFPRREQVPAQIHASNSLVVQRSGLRTSLDWAFSEPNQEKRRRTRAVVILRNDKIVGERYAPGFDQHTPLLGWSMTKSVMHAVTGILLRQGKLTLSTPVLSREWQQGKNRTQLISVTNLLEMTSGLEFDENSGNPLADVSVMLLTEPDMARFAAAKGLSTKPGSQWHYSSGNTMILSRFIRERLGDDAYFVFPRKYLFEPLRMDSAVLERDASGTFVASSFMYATARDWAKLGLLYLHDGVWQGKRILPQNWASYARSPTSQDYGAHFWRTIPAQFASGDKSQNLPEDAYHAVGHEGQFITIIPSKQLIVVRLGLTRYASTWQQDTFVLKVLQELDDLH